MAVACDGSTTQGLTTVGAALKLYLVNAAASGSSHGTLQVNGAAPSVSTMATGWTFGTVHTSNEYSDLVYASNQASGTFTTTVKPAAAPGTTNCFRTDQKLTGTFIGGNWTIAIATIMGVAGTSGTANLRVRVWRSSDPTGQTAVTEETTATQALATWVISATAQQNKTKSWTAQEFQLFDEYLFVEIACEVVSGAVSVTGSDVFLVQDGTNSVITTSAFSTAPVNGNGTTCFFAVLTSATIAANGIMYEMQAQGGTVQQQLEFGTANNATVSYRNAADTLLITGPTMVVGQWYFFAVVTSGTNAVFYWKPVGMDICSSGTTAAGDDLSSANLPASLELGQFTTGGFGAPCSFAGLCRWNAQLSQAELELESRQVAPVRTVDLLGFWPLDSASDLRCENNRSRDLQPLGTPTTVVGPPIPSRVRATPRVKGLSSGSSSTGYTGSISESVNAPTDAVTRTQVLTRGIGESVGAPTDGITRTQALVRSLSDSLGAPIDTVARVVGFARAVGDSTAALTDAVSRSQVLARATTDSIAAPADAATTAQVLARALSENLAAPTDAATRVLVQTRLLSESVAAPTDATARASVSSRSISEPVSAPIDAVACTQALTRSIGDALTALTDSTARALVEARSVAEPVMAPTDGIARGGVFARSLSESVSAPTDATARVGAFARSANDSLSVPTDSASGTVGSGGAFTRSIGEGLSAPIDVVARALVLVRSIGENLVALTDSAVRTAVTARALAEAISAPADAVSHVLARLRVPAENVPAPTDSLGRALVTTRVVADTLSALTDAVSYSTNGSFSRGVADSLSAPTDALLRTFVGTRALAEAFGAPVDAMVRALVTQRVAADALTALADVIARTGVTSRALAEALGAPTDADQRAINFPRALGEAFAAPTDSAARVIVTMRLVPEALLGPADTVVRLFVGARSIAEAVPHLGSGPPVDRVTRTASLGRAVVAETLVALRDSAAPTAAAFRAVAEMLSAPSDAAPRVLVQTRNVPESLAALLDAVVGVHGKYRFVGETLVALADVVTGRTGQTRNVNEALATLFDSVATGATNTRLVYDALPLPTDSVVYYVWSPKITSVFVPGQAHAAHSPGHQPRFIVGRASGPAGPPMRLPRK